MVMDELKEKERNEKLNVARHAVVDSVLVGLDNWSVYAVAENPKVAFEIVMKLIDDGEYNSDQIRSTAFLVHNEETVKNFLKVNGLIPKRSCIGFTI